VGEDRRGKERGGGGGGMRDEATGSAAELLAPRMLVPASSRVQELERFSHYVGTLPQICSCFPSSIAHVVNSDGTIGFYGLALLFEFQVVKF